VEDSSFEKCLCASRKTQTWSAQRSLILASVLTLSVEYAAAFFLLADCLKDAVNVILNQLKDLQLAIAVTRVYEGERGPILKNLLQDQVLPLAAQEGNRWLASWAFWMLHRRDMAVRALIVGRPVLLIETTNLSLSRLFIHYSKRLNLPICKQSYFSQMIQRLLFYTLNYDRRRYRLSEVPRKSRPKLNGLSCFIMLVYMTEWAVIYWRWTLVCSLEL
jgi:hypothetical protein